MDIDISIHTKDGSLAFDLFGKTQLKSGDVIDLGDGASITYHGTQIREAVGTLEILMLSLSIPPGVVASALIASWLWNRLKGRSVQRLVIERTEVELEEGSIRRKITERITREQ